MASSYPKYPFESLLAAPLRNGLTRPTAIRGAGVKMVNMGEVFAHARLSNAFMDRVPLSDVEARLYLLEPYDLLFARQSLVLSGAGKCTIFLGDSEPVTYEGHLIRARIDTNKADPLFYHYYFSSMVGRQAIESIVEQVAAAGIRASDLAKLKVLYLPLDEQRAIARILGALDDKIELNRKMNETLEAIARVLFQSWFVDFDPVRAKAEGRPPADLDADTAALFPDSLTDSSLGQIPIGWEIHAIGETVRVVGGSTPSTANPEYWDGGTFHWVTPKDLSNLSNSVMFDTERMITQAGLSQISSGLLPIGTVLLSSRAPIGYLAITEIPVAINQGFIALICNSRLPNYYILQWAKVNMESIISRANGTTFLEVSKTNFRPIPIIMPSSDVLAIFVSQVEELHNMVVSNLRQSHTLATIRDTLLPKLLSGEIQVRDVENIVEKVV